MKKFRLVVVAIAAALPMLSATASTTINFGPSAPTPTLPNGYKGFNWYGAENAQYYDSSSSGFDSAGLIQFGRVKAFDLDSATLTNFSSDAPSGGDTISFATTISGYYNGALVKSVTEDYGFGGGAFSGLNIDDVNKITFSTIATRTIYPEPGTFSGPDLTLVSQVIVDKKPIIAKAPELDAATAASALTLTIGCLLMLRGRRTGRLAAVSA